MSRKTIYGILGLLFVVAAVVMYAVGNKSSHLSELKDFWWYPLPLAALCLLGAATPNKRSKLKRRVEEKILNKKWQKLSLNQSI